MEYLEERLAELLELSKGFLEKQGSLSTMAIFEKLGLPPVVEWLDMSEEGAEKSHKKVQQVILRALPDAVFVVSDAWMVQSKSPKIPKDYKRGWVEQQPNKTEAIVITAGSVNDGVKAIIQPYKRKGKKIIYGEVLKQGTIESAFFGNTWKIRRNAEIKQAQREAEKSVIH